MLTQVVDTLTVEIYPSPEEIAVVATNQIRGVILEAIATQGVARVIWATGNSQLGCLSHLVQDSTIPWEQVICFHLDEYLGSEPDHSASFCHYLKTRLEDQVHPQAFHYLHGDCLEPLDECDRYGKLLQANPIDLCCLGVGNNGHLAFNEPSVANFADPYAVKLVKLDEKNRQQQYSQGHFPSLDQVPGYGFTITLSQIFRCRQLICLAPQIHKAAIVKQLLTGPIVPTCPASLLRRHPGATLLIDTAAASLWR